MLQDNHLVLNPQAQAFCFQSFDRLVDGFVGQDKSPPVDGNHESGPGFLKDLQSLLRSEVVMAEPII